MGKYIGHLLVARPELDNIFWTDSTTEISAHWLGFQRKLLQRMRKFSQNIRQSFRVVEGFWRIVPARDVDIPPTSLKCFWYKEIYFLQALEYLMTTNGLRLPRLQETSLFMILSAVLMYQLRAAADRSAIFWFFHPPRSTSRFFGTVCPHAGPCWKDMVRVSQSLFASPLWARRSNRRVSACSVTTLSRQPPTPKKTEIPVLELFPHLAHDRTFG